MFEKIAKKFQTSVLVLLVTLLSLVFVLQFGGPQAEGCTAGGANYAAKVYGTVITEGDFSSAYTLGRFRRFPLERQKQSNFKQHVLNGLIERNLLARKARELGFRVSEEDVMKRLADENTIFLSLGVDTPVALAQQLFLSLGARSNEPTTQAALRINLENEEGEFDKERAKGFIQNHLRRSISEFASAQVEERLAHRLRQTIRATVSVSPRELWEEYVRKNDKARIEYVRFSPRYYRAEVSPSKEKLAKWTKENADRIDEEYQARKADYTDLDRQAHSRHIEIRVPSDASEEKKQELRRRAERIVQKVRGGADFAGLARKHSDDRETARKGGDLGWNGEGSRPAPHDEIVFGLEEGAVSDVVEHGGNFHIFYAAGFREGDVPEEKAKREIAERLYRDERASELARRAAETALTKMREGTGGDALDEWLRQRRGQETASEADAGTAQTGGGDPGSAPKVEKTDPFGPGAQPITGLPSGPLVEKVFNELSEEKPFPQEPMELGDELVAFKLIERQRANRDDFTEDERRRLLQRLLPQKQQEAVRLYVHHLRDQAKEEGAIQINEDVLAYGDQPDEEQPRRLPGQF